MIYKELYPLTLPQQSFYYDYLIHQDNCKYNMGGAMILNGDLDIELFKKAFNYTIQKYDILRLRFVTRDGELLQTFLPKSQCDIDYKDFRNSENPLEAALLFVEKEHFKPYSFEDRTLSKDMILQTGNTQFIWFPFFHHFSNDAYGRSIIHKTVSETYNSLLTNGIYPDIQPFSYRDFIADDLKYRSSDAFKFSSEFWRMKLTPLPEPLDFTSKKNTLKKTSTHNERITLNLHRICYASMLKVAEQAEVTTFHALLGILFSTFYKLFNKSDLIIGMPVLNRSNHKFRNTPGLFMNMIPFRLHLEEKWTLTDILKAIKGEIKECYRHQRLPLSETFRHFRNNPEFKNELFDVTIVYRKMDFSHKLGNSRLRAVTLDTHIRSESFGLEIDEYDDEENVNLLFNYNPQVLSELEVIQFARCFESILFELIYFPDKSIADVQFLSEFEHHKLIRTFNNTGKVKQTNQTIVSKFNDCVHKFPDSISILRNDESITYSELNRKANQIADFLLESHNVTQGDIVCVIADRSILTIAAMLGVMKAGAAFLPVDKNNPIERIEFILKNSDTKILITDNYELKKLTKNVILLNEIENSEKDHAFPEMYQHDLAYIIYTSGSTGTPKGVMIEHGSFMNMFVNLIGNYGVSQTDRVLQFASLGFDAAIFEIFQALLTGATLAIADKNLIQDPESFINYMNAKKITFATLPPAYLSILGKPEFPFLHTLVTAGEQANISDINHYKKFKKIINGYGPTETSVCASYHIAEKEKEYIDFIPIGKPVPGTFIYILNENLEQMPIGYSGELCISGSTLARGYLNNMELTAKKFVPNPFEQNLRMYRSGDKARFLADGSIEFLGRIDEQVKINGNRVELGEIENRLRSYPFVKEAVVLDVDMNSSKELSAFIIVDQEIDLKSLRKFLLEFLPDYMVPLHFCFIEKIPLTQNGKINKTQLRKLAATKTIAIKDSSLPSTITEQKIIPIFEQVLNYSPIGVNDNFFELGGDSLKIARLITYIKKELQQEINFKTIFDKPTVRGVATELELITIKQYVDIPIEPTREYYPLSHAQKRLWILSQDRGNAAVYTMPIPLLLEGILNVEALKRSINTIVARHDALRTVFIEIDGIPFQKVLPTFENFIREIDFSKEKNAEEKGTTYIGKEVMTPFNLSGEIPMRLHLVKIKEDKFIFLLMIHHIAGDGISIGTILKELSQLYNSPENENQKNLLKPITIQYKDYCAFEQSLLQSDKYQKEKEFWLDKLKNPLPVLNLPTDKVRPPIKSYNGGYLLSEIDSSLKEALLKFGKENSVSPFMVLLASVNILLHKYTSQDDIIVGTPVSGRNHQNLENQVGVYINTVALRNIVSGDKKFFALLEEVKSNSANAFSNSNYPFDSLIQSLELERDTSRSPLFDLLVQYQNQDVTNLKLNNVKSSFYMTNFEVTKFDLTFTFTEKNDNVGFSIAYNKDLFYPQRIERMARHLINILSNVLDNPSITIKDIDILDQAETELLVQFATGSSFAIDEKTVLDLFEEQVKNTPDNIALIFNDCRLSYNELDQRANIIANEILANISVKPDEIIGIMAPRSELIALGIVGILKTGAAYLPISLDMPDERLRFMLRDSNCKVLLTGAGMLETVKKTIDLIDDGNEDKIVVLDISCIKNPIINKPLIDLSFSNLAYVIYTSGSTGVPKGVMIEHRSLVNLVFGLSKAIYKVESTPLNIALISPFVFDASVKQLFYALLFGHCLDIVPDEVKMNGRKLLEYYENHRINVSDGTPVHLEIIVDELIPNTNKYLPGLFLIGGQQLSPQTVKQLFAVTGRNAPTITNVYGPTECCDVSTCYTISKESIMNADMDLNSIPIGMPLPNVQVFILDANLSPTPIGVNGELCIGGEGLARGYINRTDLTIDKYIHVNLNNCTRIYKTGDIGRYLENGLIVLSGRTDDQIKIRGFRVELNEIESCIRNFGGINLVAVIVVGAGNYQEIAAYYSANVKINNEDLRHFLSLHLPVYMMPSYLIRLDSFPVTRNGKIDKKSFPIPVKEVSVDLFESQPGDLLEERLSEMWKEFLQLQRISLTGNFFNLGGHSLIAIRLASRIHKEFNIEISIWEIFQYPTISSLAKLLRSKNPSLFNPIEKMEERDYYPLSHSQRRLWMLAKLEGHNSLYNLPAVLLLKGNLNLLAFEKSFQSIVQRHESFRTTFIEVDGKPYQKISDNLIFKIENSDFPNEEWDESDLKELANDYFQKEFDLSQAPLMQIKLISLAENNYLFLFNMHHIIGDGWSIDTILKEFEFYYNSFHTHSEEQLLPLRIQYKDYANWQNKILGEQSLAPIKEYWHKKLSKPHPHLNLPTDFSRTESFSVDGDLLSYSLDPSTTKSLIDISNNQNASIFMTLLSAVYILLYKYTGEEDIMVGSPVAGRQHYDLENQIGFFINTLVLRSEINPENSFQEILNKVNKTLAEALDNQIYPFDRLVDELDVERIQNRNPLFDVMVAWMVKDGMKLKMNFNGIEASGLDFRITKSMFDLSFLFADNEGEITCAIEYNTSLFRKESIQRMASHFNKLVESIISNPKEKLKNLEIIQANEKEKLLSEFNSIHQPIDLENNVIHQFRNQAKIKSGVPAIVDEEKSISYDELDRLSNKIANQLIDCIAPNKDDIIAVLINDTMLAVATLLGVMKTGAAYLPIMSDNPDERIIFILNDSNSKAVIVDSNINSERIGLGKSIKNKIPVIDIRTEISLNQSAPTATIEPTSLAYVIYTSGSTGEPKGVLIEHESLTNLVLSLYERTYSYYKYNLNELMISSFAFDVSLKQLFATLCQGNTLHVISKEKRLDPREIIKYIIDKRINIIDLTPSLFSVMLDEGFGEKNKPDLREMFLGSEALPFKLVKQFYANKQNQHINTTNFYGPTECCVESSFYQFQQDKLDEKFDIAPIGKPVLNEQIYILDKYLNLNPEGIPGEICIAGKGLARQYLNDPEKTSEKFVNFPALKNTRIYKTGDLGRLLPDGNIEFMGRMDEQVKIRGYRVELQEIEKHLREFKEIKECAVTLYGNDSTAVLAAYYTSDEDIDPVKLKSHLERFLPKYMVPSYYNRLDKIPLSKNGKANKKLLPSPSGHLKQLKSREPQDEIERLILRIYSEVLLKETIQLEDNFFEIGGNSLNAVRVISRIQRELNIDLALKEIFYTPVLLDISEKVKKSILAKKTFQKNDLEGKIIVPMSDDELELLSNMQFDDE